LDPSVFVDQDCLTSRKLGVNIYAPERDEQPDAPAWSLLVFGDPEDGRLRPPATDRGS
jgi:hypothetical protein